MSTFGKQVDGTDIPSNRKYRETQSNQKKKNNCRNMHYLGKIQMNIKDEINIYKDPVVGL